MSACSPTRRQAAGIGRLRHRRLVLDPLFAQREADRRLEDHVARLDGAHPARRERPTIAHALDHVVDGLNRLAGAQKVRMQRMDVAFVDRPAGGHHGLREDQAAEEAPLLLVGVGVEVVIGSLFDIEDAEEVIECFLLFFGHGEGGRLAAGNSRVGMCCETIIAAGGGMGATSTHRLAGRAHRIPVSMARRQAWRRRNGVLYRCWSRWSGCRRPQQPCRVAVAVPSLHRLL